MILAPEFLVLNIVVCAAAANGILICSFLSQWLGGQPSQISRRRKPPMDSDLRVCLHLAVIGAGVAAGAMWLAGVQDSEIMIPASVVSFFLGQSYGMVYTRKLNLFYLHRARRLFDEGDTRGAAEDAREVARSSTALRPDAKSILRAVEAMRSQVPLEDFMPKHPTISRPARG
ncbi:MAG: hypothetical protein AAF497_15780 [Planctomycetota bacterium]